MATTDTSKNRHFKMMRPTERMSDEQYNDHISSLRSEQYPMLGTALYLDHAAAPPASRLALDRAHAFLTSNLLSNPHSSSSSSQRTTALVDRVRLDVLLLFNADPEAFDVVFTANATASIKLVADSLRDTPQGFWYGYQRDAHTSLVGVRQVAREVAWFEDDEAVETWLRDGTAVEGIQLFVYPGQSNLDGRRLPLDWCRRVRASKPNCFTLFDAAALVSTSPFDLSDAAAAPDFTSLSFYKTFGLPDLGALIIRRDSAHVLRHRRYFGGGTVDSLVGSFAPGALPWHRLKIDSPHDYLEDGTLPFHSIAMLDAAMSAHKDLFGSLALVSRHTQYLISAMHARLSSLRHANGRRAVVTYGPHKNLVSTSEEQGPVLAFNLQDDNGEFVDVAEVAKLAFARDVHFRVGTACNPGGSAYHLNLTPRDLQDLYHSGHRCGSGSGLANGRPNALIRVSLGAMSTMHDVGRFVAFLEEFYVSKDLGSSARIDSPHELEHNLCVESITIYPIKSCGGWNPDSTRPWPVRPQGFEWDREWCIIDATTGKALSQKRYPRMALIRPELDLDRQTLRMSGTSAISDRLLHLEIPLQTRSGDTGLKDRTGEVCGVPRLLQMCELPDADGFFSQCIGVPCRLARYPKPSRRDTEAFEGGAKSLSNESPILVITRASLDALNKDIAAQDGRAAVPASFRPNIVIRSTGTQGAQAWAEDDWRSLRIGTVEFSVLGGCQRCQMVCIDQQTGQRDPEPFSTLAKTRRQGGRVMFGVHTGLSGGHTRESVQVGDMAVAMKRMEAQEDVGINGL